MAKAIDLENTIKELEGLSEHPFVMTDAEIKFFLAQQPTIDPVKHGYVLSGVLDQVRWERDVAIEQLNSYGIQLGEKAELEIVKHGKWEFGRQRGEAGYWCTNCKSGFTGENAEWIAKEHDFCPKCGDDMRGDQE